MNAFQIRVSCTDCTDVVEQGCFGGGYGWVETALIDGFTHDGQHYLVDGGGASGADAAAFEDRVVAAAVADKGRHSYDVGQWVFEVVSTNRPSGS